MNKNTEKYPEVRMWIKLNQSDMTDTMKEDMKEFKTQSDFFAHILTVYYKFLTKKQNGRK